MRYHVVPMINDRRVRKALGYSVDQCIKYKIIPCKLVPVQPFTDHLALLLTLRKQNQDIRVFYEADKVKVCVGFPRFGHKLTMTVITNTVVIVNRINNRLTERVRAGAREIRVAYMDFAGNYESHRIVQNYTYPIDFAVWGAWHVILKKVDGLMDIVTYNIA